MPNPKVGVSAFVSGVNTHGVESVAGALRPEEAAVIGRVLAAYGENLLIEARLAASSLMREHGARKPHAEAAREIRSKIYRVLGFDRERGRLATPMSLREAVAGLWEASHEIGRSLGGDPALPSGPKGPVAGLAPLSADLL